MNLSECTAGLGNTGESCTPIIGISANVFAVYLKDADGNRNGIDLENDTIDDAYITARLNDTDPTQRWYPVGALKNVTDEREDPITETAEDGSVGFIQEGIRKASVQLWEGSQILCGKLNTFRNKQFGLFCITTNGDLVGTIGNSQDSCNPTMLYPIAVDPGSWYSKFVKLTNSVVQKLMVTWNWLRAEKDENLRVIEASEMDTDLLIAEGLKDVCDIISDEDQTTFTATMRLTGYGSATAPIPMTGLVIGDFALYNVTDSLAVTISTVTETSDGVYVFTFASQTLGDVLRLTPTKTGYAFDAVVAELIQVPFS